MNDRIADFMTSQPWTIHVDDSIALARRMLLELRVHHLPVIDAHEVVGIVTTQGLARATEHDVTVADVMEPTRCVSPDALVGDVIDLMTREHYDAIVVTERRQVTGIFTTPDALRVMAELLRQRAA